MLNKLFIIFTVLLSSLLFSFEGVSAVGLDSPYFDIYVDDISPGGHSLTGGSAEETAGNTLETIITKMIVAFGVLSLFIMTVGGGYMIIYHGQDELLSKGKSIFMAGLISLVVALSAGILVQLVAYLLYKGT